jgi:hypothetical protein
VADPNDPHRERRVLFSSDVARYELGRPSYPRRVFDLLVEAAHLGPGS